MLIATTEGKTLLCSVWRSISPCCCSPQACLQPFSLCLAPLQHWSCLLFLILLLELAAEQHVSSLMDCCQMTFKSVIQALPLKASFDSDFRSESGSHHSVLRLFLEGDIRSDSDVGPLSHTWRRELPLLWRISLSAGALLAEARVVILVVSRRELSGWHVRDVSACDAVGKAELGFRSVLCKWSLADISIMTGLGAPCFQNMKVTVYDPCGWASAVCFAEEQSISRSRQVLPFWRGRNWSLHVGCCYCVCLWKRCCVGNTCRSHPLICICEAIQLMSLGKLEKGARATDVWSAAPTCPRANLWKRT